MVLFLANVAWSSRMTIGFAPAETRLTVYRRIPVLATWFWRFPWLTLAWTLGFDGTSNVHVVQDAIQRARDNSFPPVRPVKLGHYRHTVGMNRQLWWDPRVDTMCQKATLNRICSPTEIFVCTRIALAILHKSTDDFAQALPGAAWNSSDSTRSPRSNKKVYRFLLDFVSIIGMVKPMYPIWKKTAFLGVADRLVIKTVFGQRFEFSKSVGLFESYGRHGYFPQVFLNSINCCSFESCIQTLKLKM